MLLDALAWNMLNIIRVELALNCYKLYDIFLNSSFKSPRGQYALASFAITILAMLTIQFNFSWLLTIYATYLTVGVATWLYRRVYFYHRKLDSYGVNQTINNFDANKHSSSAAQAAAGALQAHHDNNNYATSHKSHKSNGAGSGNGDSHHKASSSASSSSAPPPPPLSSSDNTNSLQRQRASAYRDFRSLLTEPRQTHKEFALSLAHLSNLCQLFVGKDVFDEMHFQILATRRDVLNVMLRAALILGATILAYMR